MVSDVLDMVRAWLLRPDVGVNAYIARLPLLATDALPPDVTFIGTATRDEIVARYQDPPSTPALYVSVDGPATGPGETISVRYREYDTVPVAVRYITRQPTDASRTWRDTLATLRAVVASLREFHENAHIDARTQNGVTLIRADSLTFGPAEEDVEESNVTGGVLVMYVVRDELPSLNVPAAIGLITDGLLNDWYAAGAGSGGTTVADSVGSAPLTLPATATWNLSPVSVSLPDGAAAATAGLLSLPAAESLTLCVRLDELAASAGTLPWNVIAGRLIGGLPTLASVGRALMAGEWAGVGVARENASLWPGPAFVAGDWHTVGYTDNGARVSLYVDGLMVAQAKASGAVTADPAATDWTLGNGLALTFTRTLRYNRELTAAEMLHLHNAVFRADVPTLPLN